MIANGGKNHVIGNFGEDAFSVEKNGSRHLNSKENITLQPGYRSDVLVKAKNPGKYYLTQVPLPSKKSIGIINPEPGTKQWLAMVEVVQGQENTPLPDKLAPKPFESITQEEIGDRTTRTITFDIKRNETTKLIEFLADGQEYHSNQLDRILNLPLGAAEQLKLVSNNSNHPFHIHVNPFEVISIGGGEQKPHVWRDTILVSKDKPVIIRTRYNPKYPGKAVYHCHILEHEDRGMMRAVNFVAEHKKDK